MRRFILIAICALACATIGAFALQWLFGKPIPTIIGGLVGGFAGLAFFGTVAVSLKN